MNEIKKINVNGTIYSLNVDVVEGYLSSGNFYKVEQTAVDYVEIGGLKWATKNIGATAVTDTGLYFQWGDTQGYTAAQVGIGSGQKYFGWADYKYGNGTSSPGNTGMTKYNSSDGKTVLDLEDDAARANMGGSWRMPTTEEFAALDAAVNSAWTADYQGSGVSGLVLTDKTDSSKVLFFPAAGNCRNGTVRYVGSLGNLWSSSFIRGGGNNAYDLLFSSGGVNCRGSDYRYYGFAVRGVWDGEGTPVIPQPVQVTPEQNKLYVDTTTNKIYRYDGSSYVEVSSAPSYTLDEVSDGSTRKLNDYPKKTIEITWANLKAARDNSQLVPGQWYRITDYHTTTVQSETQSADHQFDVIVRADSTNKLNENAFAALHSGDTYFSTAGARLEAWELKYTIDNDEIYGWADTTNGKGVIFFMKDEWDNECGYDFKNIQFKRYKTTKSGAFYHNKYYGYHTDMDGDAPSDATLDKSDYKWFYTFSRYTNNYVTIKDGSLTLDSDCYFYNNVIPSAYDPWGDYGTNFMLNNIVFETNSGGCYGNTFGVYCIYCTIGNEVYNNSIGNSCYYNSIGNNFGSNTIGEWFQNNSIGNYFQYNSIGNNCYGNTIGNNMNNNSIGNGFGFNSIGNEVYNNSIGNSFNGNSIGNNCYYNSIGNYFDSNTIGNNFQKNSIGNSCYNINFEKDYIYNVIIENGNHNINITSTQTTSGSNLLRNFTIAQGVNNTETTKTISHNTVNDTFKTTYQPQNSQTVSV